MSGVAGLLGVDDVLQILDMLWSPAVEAMKVQKELNVRSLAETIAAAERAGCQVCYADLPEKVGGFATVIAETPLIVVNRAKPPHHNHYTVSHELGHHLLHLSRVQPSDTLGFPSIEDMQEYQAHMFAIAWVWFASKPNEERETVLKQNPETMLLPVAMFSSLGVILFAALSHLAARLFPSRPANWN